MKMPPRFKFQDPDTWESSAWAEAESILEKMGQVLPALGPVRKNTWYGCEPGLVLPSDLGRSGLLQMNALLLLKTLKRQ